MNHYIPHELALGYPCKEEFEKPLVSQVKKIFLIDTSWACPEVIHFPQIFGASAIWHKNKMENKIATYDLFIRDLPKNRNFMLLGGVEEIIKGILNWKYSDEEINFLLEEKIITENFADYLRNFKFTGDVYAMKEGTAFFPNEPVIRVTATIIEGNVITLFLINAITGNTIFFTKFIRSIIAAKGKTVIGPGGIRAQGFDTAMKACRAAHLCGTSIILPSFYRKYNMKMPSVIMIGYHAYIKSFPAEIDAMKSISETFPHREISLMIDTYDINSGLKNAITVIQELKSKNEPLPNIFIDSGDLFELAKMARRELENAGLKEVKIAIASNLDEFKIHEYMKKEIPADSFVVCTEGITSSDDPKLETVYKMAELRDGDRISNLAKLTKGKVSLPGRKNIFRIYKDGKMARDIIGEEGEDLGEPLLIKMIENGELIYDLPEMDEIRSYIKEQVNKLPEPLLEIDKQNKYEVKVSKKLEELLEEVKYQHLSR